MVLDLGYSPEDAWAPFERLPDSMFSTFRDASYCTKTYGLSVLACLKGLNKATTLGWYSPSNFCAEEYEHMDRSFNMHMMAPKFLAFKGPKDAARFHPSDYEAASLRPECYVDLFNKLGVTGVVRLNEAHTYDRKAYTDRGINHYDIYFDDCTIPDHSVVEHFLKVTEKESGVLAVHCLAGLGRTGTLIACYLIKHYGFTASEAIGWLRIVRPGSVIGLQQQFLHWYEAKGHHPRHVWETSVTLLTLRAAQQHGSSLCVSSVAGVPVETDDFTKGRHFDFHETDSKIPLHDPKMLGQMIAHAQVERANKQAALCSQGSAECHEGVVS